MAEGRSPARFSMVWETVAYAMGHAEGARVSDFTALLALMRYQGDGPELSRPVDEMARELGARPDTVRRALSRLTRLEYTRPDGGRSTILTRTGRGGTGRTATYRLNVPREW